MRDAPGEPKKDVEAVGAVVLRRDGRVVLVRRGRPPGAGTWTLPGGRVEPGESREEAVERELREECGLAVRVVTYLETVRIEAGDRAFAIHEHLCVPLDDDAPLVAGDDAADAMWARDADFDALGVTPAVRAVVARARRVL